jgi:hypothetical protein
MMGWCKQTGILNARRTRRAHDENSTSGWHLVYIAPPQTKLVMQKSLSGLLLFAIIDSTQAQEMLDFAPVQDAVLGFHFQLNAANTNYNNADWFGALSQPGNMGGENNSRSLILFDLSSLAAGTAVDEALLDLYGRGPVGLGAAASVGNLGANACWLEHVIEPWDDNDVTWNTQPSTTPLNAVAVPASSLIVEDYIGLDVTNMVQAMINSPGMAYGFALRIQVEDPTCGLFFCGADHSDPTKHPRLRIKLSSSVDVTEKVSLAGPLIHPNPVLSGSPCRLLLHDHNEVVTVMLFDHMGRSVLATKVEPATSEALLNIPLAPGTYQAVIQDPRGAVIGRSALVVLVE